MKIVFNLTKILLLAGTALAACAHAQDATSILRKELHDTPAAGKFLQSFAGPDGLTGAVLEVPGGQKMLVYLTPDGRYMISGAVIDLMTHANLTMQYAHEYVGQPKQPGSVQAGAALVQAQQMARVVFGNAHAPSYLEVVFDPSTPQGRKVMYSAMNSASKVAGTYLYSKIHIDFIPYGPDAAQILQGDNAQRLRNLLAFAEGKKLAPATKFTQTEAAKNSLLASRLGIEPPAMISFLPGMKTAKAVSFKGAGNNLPAQVQAMIDLTGGGAQ